MPENHGEIVEHEIQKAEVVSYWKFKDQEGHFLYHVVVLEKNVQKLIDILQEKMKGRKLRVLILHVDAVAESEMLKLKSPIAFEEGINNTREELYSQIRDGFSLDFNFVMMTLLSTIVAAIGLIEGLVVLVIGAMVIAPLLGPNLAISFATLQGDKKLLFRGLKTNLAGIVITLVVAYLIGMIWAAYPETIESNLLKHIDLSLTNIVIALASGAAAALALLSSYSAALTGVMVTVSLLPPLVATGILAAIGKYDHSLSFFMIFLINLICINLSSNLIFVYKKVYPRSWREKREAFKSILRYTIFWFILLILVGVVTYFLLLH